MFKKGAAKVILHDEVVAAGMEKINKVIQYGAMEAEACYPIIFADAVKWVRVSD